MVTPTINHPEGPGGECDGFTQSCPSEGFPLLNPPDSKQERRQKFREQLLEDEVITSEEARILLYLDRRGGR